MAYQGKLNHCSIHNILLDNCLGYIDDTRNTDNAWVEAEIWNFHYGSTMSLSNVRTDMYCLIRK